MNDETNLHKFFTFDEEPVCMRGGFSKGHLPKPWDVIWCDIMRYITLEDQFEILYFYHFPILNHFRNLDQISFLFLLLNFTEDIIFKARRKEEDGRPFYFIHEGFMNKLYTHHLAQNLPLLVKPLAIANPQVSLDPSYGPSHKKSRKPLS